MHRLLLLGFLVAASVFAQDPVPDTTDWHSYYPLQIGNEWQHRYELLGYPDEIRATRLVGDSLIDGTPYFLAETCRTRNETGDPPLCSDEPSLIRYEEDHAAVIERVEDQGSVYFRLWLEPCRLDLPHSSHPMQWTCFDGTLSGGRVTVEYGVTLDIEGSPAIGSWKSFTGGFIYHVFLSGLGLSDVWYEGDATERLVFARVNGVEYGSPVINVGTESEAPVAGSDLTLYPNPFRDTALLDLDLDTTEALTLEVFDVQGRRVRAEVLGAFGVGRQSVAFDRGSLPPGAYRLRVSGDRGFEAVLGVIVLR